ncbi:unknown [Bacteroides sp. CAG:875]|nr:unknown [Bacteroides sp. CAG:875]
MGVHGQGFALGDGQGKLTAHLRQVLPVGIHFSPVGQRKQRLTFTAHQALQQGKVFLAIQQLVVQPQDVLCHSRDRGLCDDHLRPVSVVHPGEGHPGSLVEELLAGFPVFLRGSHIGLEQTQQAVHFVEGSDGAVVLGIGRKKPTDKHRYPLHGVFGYQQGTVGAQRRGNEERVFRNSLPPRLTVLVFRKQHTRGHTHIVLLADDSSFREKKRDVFSRQRHRHTVFKRQRHMQLFIQCTVAPFGIQQASFPVFKQFFVHRFTMMDKNKCILP